VDGDGDRGWVPCIVSMSCSLVMVNVEQGIRCVWLCVVVDQTKALASA
jgi:hypothetical protein